MKKIAFTLLLTALISGYTTAQDNPYKYGKISDEEMKMNVYPKDTTANAVVIYDDGDATYMLVNNSFQLTSRFKKRIKILKHEGVDEANITIPYYSKSSSEREYINGLEAISYNMENGKLVKTKLEKKNIFDEEVNGNYKRLKFTIPNVKEGSVIELKYEKASPFVWNIDSWYIQGDVPVMNSIFEIKIPEYFLFNYEVKGYENIKTENIADNQSFTVGSGSQLQTVTCNAKVLKFVGHDIPALKDEVYVWHTGDFLSSVHFELKATNFPYEFYKPYSQTWDDLDKTIKDKTDFGDNLKMGDPFKDEMKNLLTGVTDDKTKIEKIYQFLKDHISWNETYSFYGNKAKDAIKLKTGDNGQINMILLSMLKDADILCYPVMISRRSMGRLPYTYPSFDQLNTFVVAAETPADGKIYYMDGASIYGGLNTLNVDLLVDRGRILSDIKSDKWVDLSKISKSQQVSTIAVHFNESGNIEGTNTSIYSYENALFFRKNYKAAKDSVEYVDKMAEKQNIQIEDYSLTGLNAMDPYVKESYSFTKEISSAGDMIYINPMIFPQITENPFKESERKLPIEFDYPKSYIINCTITLPDNYQVVELPKSVKGTLNDNCKYLYLIQQTGNKISISYRYEMNQIIFPNTDYDSLKQYFGQVATQNQEMIVLKKI